MVMFCFGLMGGMILAAVFVGGGVLCARDKDSGCASMDRCEDQLTIDREEALNILNTLRIGASNKEKAALDYAKGCIDIAHKLAEYWKG